jgi:hypothetical protein
MTFNKNTSEEVFHLNDWECTVTSAWVLLEISLDDQERERERESFVQFK